MALVVKDRVKETTTTTGTGTITLAGASLGFQAFSVIGNANTTYYTISDSVTGAFEVGIGTYTSSGTTLSRTTILESSNAGAAVNFAAGSKDVFVVYPAEKAVYQDTAGDVTVAGNITGQEMTASNGLLVHSALITISHVVPSGYNAIGAGPITIDSGVTVTITDGTWVIV